MGRRKIITLAKARPGKPASPIQRITRRRAKIIAELAERKPETFIKKYYNMRILYQATLARLLKELKEQCNVDSPYPRMIPINSRGGSHSRMKIIGLNKIGDLKGDSDWGKAQKIFDSKRKELYGLQLHLEEFFRTAQIYGIKLDKLPDDVAKNLEMLGYLIKSFSEEAK